MTLFFTPVKGKEAILQDWPNSMLTYEQALNIPTSTGVAVVLGQSELVTIDLDDLLWCIRQFTDIGINIEAEIKDHFNITSPKENRGKAVFKLPKGENLNILNFQSGLKKLS